MTILIYHNNRMEEAHLSSKIWNCGMSGITYFPSSSVKPEDAGSLQESINSGLDILKKARIKA